MGYVHALMGIKRDHNVINFSSVSVNQTRDAGGICMSSLDRETASRMKILLRVDDQQRCPRGLDILIVVILHMDVKAKLVG